MDEEIGAVAGAVWHVLNGKGRVTLKKLKKQINCKARVFDWAIGWLAREGKIWIEPQNRSFIIKLKDH